MSTLPPAPPATPPTIPLTLEVRTAYENLSAKYQDAFDANTDLSFRTEVLAWQTDVDNILEKDEMYRFSLDTALFEAIRVQINSTNLDLVKIKAQIAAIASDIAMAGEVVAAINKVLALVPAF